MENLEHHSRVVNHKIVLGSYPVPLFSGPPRVVNYAPRVINHAPRVINYAPRGHLEHWLHLKLSLTNVIYDRKTFIV